MLKTFEQLASFGGGVQAKPGDLTLVDAPGLPGRLAWKVRMNQSSTPLANPEQRVHCLDTEWIQPEMTLSFGTAYFIPTDRPAGRGWDATDEVHQGWHGSAQSYGGPAPGLGYMTDDQLSITIRGGPVKPDSQGGGNFIQHQWGAVGDGHGYVGPFQNGVPTALIKGRWWTKIVTMLLSPTNGWVEAEIDGKLAVPRFNCPTCYPFAMFAIPVNGYRKGSTNPNEAIHYQWSAIGDVAEVRSYLNAYVLGTPTPPGKLRKKSESATTITLEWTPVPNAYGYRFFAGGNAVSTTFNPNRSEVTFAKGAAEYGVLPLMRGDLMTYTL